MTGYSATVYDSLAEADTAIEAIDNTTNLQVIPFKDGVKTKVLVIQGSSSGFNTTVDAAKVLEQAPVDQQPLDNRLFNAVTTNQTSTSVTTLDKRGLTFFLNVTSGATGGTIEIQAINDDGDEEPIGFLEAGDTNDTRILSKVVTTGNYLFVLPPNIHPKQVNAKLSSITDGTYTLDVWGGAL